MNKTIFLKSTLVFSCMSISAHVFANDGFAALGVGGIVLSKTDEISMVKEVLDISATNIHVSYDFKNESTHDIASTVIFPLPAYPATPAESGVVAHGRPAGFTVLINEKNIPYGTLVRAEFNGIDVTEKIESYWPR